MRGQRPAYRVGRSDSRVTGTAAGANLAMLAILQAVIGTLRSALQPRCGEPRAPPAARDSSSGNSSAAAPADRPRVFGHGRPCVVAVGGVSRDRPTGDRDRMASAGLRSVVGVEVSPRGSAAPGAGAGEPHRADVARESALEPAENRQRAGEARSRRRQGHGSPLPSEDVAASSVRRIQRRIAANAVASLHLQEVRCRSSAAFQASPITFFSA